LTTLAVIGAGILGRSLIYTLAKEQKAFEKVTLFYSDAFASPCSLNSTAIVAPRGLSSGHSPLGDELLEGFKTFSEHVFLDQPLGVEKIIQYTAATTKQDEFKLRYPQAQMARGFLNHETLIALDEAYLIDPKTYMDWLLKETQLMEQYHLEVVDSFVCEVHENERVHVKTMDGRNLAFDKVIFAGGNYNRFWKDLAPESRLATSKPVQGSYFEINQVNWSDYYFYLTLVVNNLFWNKSLKRLLVGSTSMDTNHLLAPEKDLQKIYHRLSEGVSLKLPALNEAELKIGLREKARKREPYTTQNGHLYFMGGLYKNGFTLALRMARTFSHQHL
jgi:glycine/D-amino acid oxidase-like deaminating enzyme